MTGVSDTAALAAIGAAVFPDPRLVAAIVDRVTTEDCPPRSGIPTGHGALRPDKLAGFVREK